MRVPETPPSPRVKLKRPFHHLTGAILHIWHRFIAYCYPKAAASGSGFTTLEIRVDATNHPFQSPIMLGTTAQEPEAVGRRRNLALVAENSAICKHKQIFAS